MRGRFGWNRTPQRGIQDGGVGMMNEAERRRVRTAIVAFLETISRPDQQISNLGDDDGLVDSGLIDSLAMLEIVAFLESEFGLSFNDSGVDPARLSSVNSILDLIADSRA
jgi:acyl carrier protein